ncbi:hypothetical protein HUJ05_007587 [Dendroctonus ponderosae]|nr:hypothetical protein HUJ05_007587 [Dendroctonus ponderosae]
MLDEVNLDGDLFEFDKLDLDKFKLLLAAPRMSDPYYHPYCAIILKESGNQTVNLTRIREMCRAHSVRVTNTTVGSGLEQKDKSNRKRKISMDQEDQLKTVQIMDVHMGNKRKDGKFFDINMNDLRVKMQVDTNADITMISENRYTQIGSPARKKCTYKVCNADGNAINTISYKGHATTAPVSCRQEKYPPTHSVLDQLIGPADLWHWRSKNHLTQRSIARSTRVRSLTLLRSLLHAVEMDRTDFSVGLNDALQSEENPVQG